MLLKSAPFPAAPGFPPSEPAALLPLPACLIAAAAATLVAVSVANAAAAAAAALAAGPASAAASPPAVELSAAVATAAPGLAALRPAAAPTLAVAAADPAGAASLPDVNRALAHIESHAAWESAVLGPWGWVEHEMENCVGGGVAALQPCLALRPQHLRRGTNQVVNPIADEV